MEPPKDISPSWLFQNCFLLKLLQQLVSAESESLIKANEEKFYALHTVNVKAVVSWLPLRIALMHPVFSLNDLIFQTLKVDLYFCITFTL